MSPDMPGTPVNEAEIATDLGFADVYEMRRWETQIGQELADLKHTLQITMDERDRFLEQGRRMQAILAQAATLISDPDLLVAIRVVTGQQAEPDYRLQGWFPDLARALPDLLLSPSSHEEV